MNVSQWNRLQTLLFQSLVIVALLGMLLLPGIPGDAQDGKALSKEVNNEIRLSQKAMFNGKLEEAQAHLEKAAELIAQLRTVEPEFSRLKSLESTYARQKKDLDRRLPKEKSAEPEKKQTPSAAQPGSAVDVNAFAKEMRKELQTAQREMFNRHFEASRAHLDKAANLLERIKTGDPNFSQLRTLEQQYARQEKDLNKRLPKETSVETAESKPLEADQPAKLPGGVTNRLKKIDAALKQGETALTKKSIASDDYRIRNLEGILRTAQGFREEILSRYGDQIPPNHPDMIAREEALEEFQQNVASFKDNVVKEQTQAAQADEAEAAQSAEWLEQFRPYAQNGYNDEKYLIGSGTANTDELLRRKTIYQEAKVLFEDYEKTDFPNGRTDELERMAKDLAYALSGFEEGYQHTVEGFASDAGTELERLEAWLDEQEAKAGSEADRQPVTLNRDVLGRLKNMIFSFEAATAGEDGRLQDFTARLATIEERADGLRKLGVERTLMLPDTFSGAERDVIKTAASEVLRKEYADAQELRATIIRPDWQEEKAWEYTDTTKSAVRYRITRSVTTQIAAKRGSEVFLYSIHVAKDQQSDGSWSKLYGHVMFIDPMLEENVEK